MRRLAGTLAVACMAGPAQAHGTLPGGEGFYSGALHPVYAVEHLVALLALGLLLGRTGLRAPLLALAAGVAAGFAVPSLLPLPATVLLMGGAALAGLVLALVLPVPLVAAAGLAAVLGLAVGADSEAPSPAALAGLITGIALVVLNAMAAGRALADPRRVIALRVLGSWILAAALLVLALAVTANRGPA